MFTNEQVEDLIEGIIVGDRFPYNRNNEQEMKAHIRRLS